MSDGMKPNDQVADFLVSQGRMKFVRPLYRALCDAGKAGLGGATELAVGTFAANKSAYHPICRKMVGSDLERYMKNEEGKKEVKPLAVSEENNGAPSGTGRESVVVAASFAAGLGFGVVVALAIIKARTK